MKIQEKLTVLVMATLAAALTATPMADPTQTVDYARSNYVWPFATGPHYGTLPPAERRAPGVLNTPVGSFRTASLPAFPAELTAPDRLATGARLQHFVLQVDPAAVSDGGLEAIRQTVVANGGEFRGVLPVAAHIVRLTAESKQAVSSLPGVLALFPYHPALKLHPEIGRLPLPDLEAARSDVYDLDVRIFEGESASAAAAAVAKLGGEVTGVWPDTIRVRLHRSLLSELAALEPVRMIFEHVPVFGQAAEITTAIQTGSYNLGATPYTDAGADGTGQVLVMFDSGISLDAGDLSDTRGVAGTPGPAHRKVLLYETANQFGGEGDLLGCDDPASGGRTHGHVVASTALGHATDTGVAYGGEYLADDGTNLWSLNGVAPGAKLIAYDAHVTPVAGLCEDPEFAEIVPGDLYSGTSAGPLAISYDDHDARTAVIAWGGGGNTYDMNPSDIDDFVFDKKEAMVFVAAGNAGGDFNADLVPDEGTLLSPATTKNGLAIGATGVANTESGGDQNWRWESNGVGPAPGNRIAPQLMAPGVDLGTMGLLSDFACRSTDNDQAEPASCTVVTGSSGTSFAAAAAAGSAMTVRSYFAEGFYPDGTDANASNATDKVPTISGALVKAALIASADWVGVGNAVPPGGTKAYRFNNEQGYGRIQLNKVLPIYSFTSAVGLIVADLGIEGGENAWTTLELASQTGSSTGDEFTDTTFIACDDSQEIRVALAWIEPDGQNLIHDLDLEVCAPADPPCSGAIYYGNYFTDDNDRDVPPTLDPGEDCPGHDGSLGVVDESPWSLAACDNAIRDTENTTEAVFLSVDPGDDGPDGTCSVTTATPCSVGSDCPAGETCEGSDSQIVVGDWTVRVIQRDVAGLPQQRFAVAIAGGVCVSSSVRFDREVYSCNDRPAITVYEVDEPTDEASGLTATEVGGRVRLEVWDAGADGDLGTGDDAIRDTEDGPALGGPDAQLVFESLEPIVLSEGTAPDSGNGALDVRHGDFVKVIYTDEINGAPDLAHTDIARIDCDAPVELGGTVFERYGTDSSVLVEGGCEVNARGNQEFGFPDRYLDAGERVALHLAFTSPENLVDATVSLRCVQPDVDSPADCAPGSDDCFDPNRLSNAECTELTILDPEKPVGLVLADQPMTATFNILMADTISGTPTVELLLALESRVSGKTTTGLAVIRQKLDVDEVSLFYSTDFPSGGTETIDWDNDEAVAGTSCAQDVPCHESGRGTPVTSLDADLDYRFETWAWSDLTAGTDAAGSPVVRNTGLSSPWDFDTNDGGFRSGLGAASNATVSELVVIANWGEDLDFDGVLDGLCDGDTSVGCESQADCDAFAAGTCDFTLLEDRDPPDGMLSQAWSTEGGCGWQSKATGTCSLDANRHCRIDDDCLAGGAGACTGPAPATGGAWSTGRIDATTAIDCLFDGLSPGQCQSYEKLGGTSGQERLVEFLLTPAVEKVNRTLDADGEPVYEARILDWGWNASIDLADPWATFSWELDNDLDAAAPVDLTGDGVVLGAITGPYGASTTGGDPGLTGGGYPLFAPLSGGVSTNGTVGTNREGDNSCFFEGGFVSPGTPIGLSLPPDDDIDDDGDGPVDEHVTPAGPRRNFNLSHANGPDMRLLTIEDLNGPTGDRFQGGLGFWVFEAWGTPEADPGYGVAIDDMVLRWAEVRLDPDAAVCGAQGACAVLAVSPPTLYVGNTMLEITLQETSHDGDTDCDGDGAGDGTDDCDGDTAREVRVTADSDAESAGESLLLEETIAGSGFYRGTLPISTTVDFAGTLFVRPDGAQPATITVTYEDTNDGFGGPCRNDVDMGEWGTVRASATVYPRTGLVIVKSVSLSDNGDDDGYADTNETVNMAITVLNKTGVDLEGVVAWLTTDSPHVECILDPVIALGDLAAGAEFTSPGSFLFKIRGDAERTGEFDDLSATFEITMSAAQFDVLDRPQRFTLDLDLDVGGGGAASPFDEDFETPGAGSGGLEGTAFSVANLDDGIFTNALSDGYRCQYNDPDNPESNSYLEECHLGASSIHAAGVFWHRHSSTFAHENVGYSGSASAHFGILGPQPNEFTTPLATLEALTSGPLYLSHEGLGPVPELTFKHRISLLDDRAGIGVSFGQTLDRGVVQVQIADGAGVGQGPWITIEPYHNIYDAQAAANFSNCAFDPIDDGNDEDDLYDPPIPLGPSSTCFTRYGFAHLGDTDVTHAFDADAVGRATDGGALEGSTGGGAWVESRFDLKRFQGRRVRIRFLATTVEVDSLESLEQVLGWNPTPYDDGWFIDDVHVDTLDAAATVAPDTKDNSTLSNPCTDTCSVVAGLAASPTSPDAPGEPVLLDAGSSVLGSCASGAPQYQFWKDDESGVAGDGDDLLLRDWTGDPELADAPLVPTDYAVVVRCSSDPGCRDEAHLVVEVVCPSTGTLVQPFGQTIRFDAAGNLAWTSAEEIDAIEGDLDVLRAQGDFEGSARACIAEDLVTDTVAPTGDPPSGSAYYYLVRLPQQCNAITWKTTYPAAATEHPAGDRDTEIDSDFHTCKR